MKKSVLKPVIFTIALVSLTLLFAGSLFAQDTVVEKPRKLVKIKVDMDEEGNTFVFDTSFSMDEDFDMEKFKEAMKEYEVQLKEMEHHLKDIEIDLNEEEMEKAMKEVEFALQKAHCDMPYKREFHRRARGPHRLEYQYKPENVHFFGMPDDCGENVWFNSKKKGESLSDVLGDIPMSAVTSYKVKETKKGKRITIEVSNDALFDADENEILIWHSDTPPPPPPPDAPKLKKAIFIEKEIDTEEDDN